MNFTFSRNLSRFSWNYRAFSLSRRLPLPIELFRDMMPSFDWRVLELSLWVFLFLRCVLLLSVNLGLSKLSSVCSRARALFIGLHDIVSTSTSENSPPAARLAYYFEGRSRIRPEGEAENFEPAFLLRMLPNFFFVRVVSPLVTVMLGGAKVL